MCTENRMLNDWIQERNETMHGTVTRFRCMVFAWSLSVLSQGV